jgi:hypothetical protein
MSAGPTADWPLGAAWRRKESDDGTGEDLLTRAAGASRNALLHVLGQHLVNQRLVADLSPPGFLTELIQNLRVYSDGD